MHVVNYACPFAVGCDSDDACRLCLSVDKTASRLGADADAGCVWRNAAQLFDEASVCAPAAPFLRSAPDAYNLQLSQRAHSDGHCLLWHIVSPGCVAYPSLALASAYDRCSRSNDLAGRLQSHLSGRTLSE